MAEITLAREEVAYGSKGSDLSSYTLRTSTVPSIPSRPCGPYGEVVRRAGLDASALMWCC